MTDRERFAAVMSYQPVDRVPVWYFGYWQETLDRWMREGLTGADQIAEVTGMDPDWEAGMWNIHGLVNIGAISTQPQCVVEETATYRIVRTSLGALIKESTQGSSIPTHLEHALKPTRQDWKRFAAMLDPATPSRHPAGWENGIPAFNARTRVACFLAGSLYAGPREWMGVEELSYLMYDDPVLLEEILDHLSNYWISLMRPVLQKVQFDFAYFFEDCCFNTGPLLSPDLYRKHFDKYYRRMIEFYRSMSVPFMLMDSDGKVDALVPCWLDSGFDILFPIEVGTWKADPVAVRKRFGRRLRMMGGVDKHVIPHGQSAIRAHLEPLRPLVAEGGYIPLPDHRIPPNCSLEAFRTYVQVFRETLAG
jgi:hypothetical protein